MRLNKARIAAVKPLGLLLAFAIAIPAFALTRSPRPGDRIGVLRISDDYTQAAEQAVAKTVTADLRHELRDLGFDAYDARLTYDQLSRNSLPAAEYFVEIVSSNSSGHSLGGANVATGAVGVQVGVVVSHVAAQVVV